MLINRRDTPALWASSCPLLELLQQLYLFHVVGTPDLDTELQIGHHYGWTNGDGYLLSLLVTPLFMQPRIPLAFQTAIIHSWLMSTFPSSRIPKTSFAALFKKNSSPTLYTYLGFLFPKSNILHTQGRKAACKGKVWRHGPHSASRISNVSWAGKQEKISHVRTSAAEKWWIQYF